MTNAILLSPSFVSEVQEVLDERKPGVYKNVQLTAADDDNMIFASVENLAGVTFSGEIPASTFATDVADSIQLMLTQAVFKRRLQRMLIAEVGEEVTNAVTNIEFDLDYVMMDITNNGLRTTHIHNDIKVSYSNIMNCIHEVKTIYNALSNTVLAGK